MARLYSSLLCFLFLFLAVGCDSIQSLQAFVIDSDTGLPIDSVSVHEINLDKTILSDSIGFVDFYRIVGGANPPDLKMIFTKPGYEVFEMNFPPSTFDTLTLELTPE